MNVAPPLTTLSLFSGGGGLDTGVELALRAGAGLPLEGRALPRGDTVGVAPVAYVEAEAFAAAVLLARMEDGSLAPAPVWTDVATFDARPFRGLVDLVLGGSPCQDLSVAGRRAGLDGERSGLFFQFVRVVEECQPGLVFWENVGGAASSLSRVFAAFETIGYRGAAVSLRASDVGATHRRARVFLLAYRDEAGRELLRATRLHGDGQPGDDATGRGEAMGDADRVPRDEGRAQRSGGDSGGNADAGCGPCGASGGPLAHPDSREGGHQPGGRCGASRSGAAESGHGGEDVADASGEGLQGGQRPGAPGEGERAPRPASECRRHAGWPPGPTDADGWREYLARGGPAPAKPRLRRGADGLGCGCESAVWADRLRLLGNGVVPQQAAAAFRFLAGRLGGVP